MNRWLLILALLLSSSMVSASPSLVQTNSFASDGNVTSISCSYAAPPTEGNLLLAFLGNRTPAGLVTLPDGWSNVIQVPGFTPGGSLAYKVAGAGEPSNVTYEVTSATRLGLHIYEYTGIPDPKYRQNGLNTGSGSALTSGTVTSTTNDELVVTSFTINTDTSFGSWTNSFSERNDFQNTGSDRSTYAGADRVAPTPGSYSTEATTGAGANWFAITARFSSDQLMPDIVLLKSSSTISDPVNDETNPKAIPGAVVLYTVQSTNEGPGVVDTDTVVITDQVPTNAALFVGDIDGPGSGPVLFQDGAVPSGLSYTFIDLPSLIDDGGLTYDYEPLPDGEGFDVDVTHVRIRPKGEFAASSGGNDPSFELRFEIRIL